MAFRPINERRQEHLDPRAPEQGFLFRLRRACKDLVRIVVQHGNHRDLRAGALQQEPPRRFAERHDHIGLLPHEDLPERRCRLGEEPVVLIPRRRPAERPYRFAQQLPQHARLHGGHPAHVIQIVHLYALRQRKKRPPVLFVREDRRHAVPPRLHRLRHAGQHMLDTAAVAYVFMKICQYDIHDGSPVRPTDTPVVLYQK